MKDDGWWVMLAAAVLDVKVAGLGTRVGRQSMSSKMHTYLKPFDLKDYNLLKQ